MSDLNKLPYDDTDPMSIEQYAKALQNKTFRQVLKGVSIKKKGNKGSLGQLLEKHYFGYEPNSNPGPDFEKAGVELKTTPYKINPKKKNTVSKERLVLNIINFMEIHKERFESSSFLLKNKLILLIFYLYQEKENVSDNLDFLINPRPTF